MKIQKIFLGLALALTLTGCNQKPNSADKNVTEEKISQALDGNVKTTDSQNQNSNTTSTDKNKTTEKKSKNVDKNGIDYDMWRDMIVNIGDFSPTLAKNLTDDQLKELILNARKVSEETGYWDVKDFVFQDLGKTFPELSNKFPVDSIEKKYSQKAAVAGEYSGKFDYERQQMIDLGYPSKNVWAVDDKTVQDAFHKAYEKDEELYYDDYVKNAAKILFGTKENSDDSKKADKDDKTNSDRDKESSSASEDSKTKTEDDSNKLRHYGSSQTDYDAIKAALVQYYEFSPSSVNQMTNEDIDIAYTRAMKKLESTGYGDIGLIFEELGNMFPGASKMYPGNGGTKN